MKEKKWFQPYTAYLNKIKGRIRFHYWISLINSLILIGAIGVFVYFYYTRGLPDDLDQYDLLWIYGYFILFSFILVLSVGQTLGLLFITHDLRKHMFRFFIVVTGSLLIIVNIPILILTIPLGFAYKKLFEKRYLKRMKKFYKRDRIAAREEARLNALLNPPEEPKPLLEPYIPGPGHEEFVLAFNYLRGENGYQKDMYLAIHHLKKAATDGNYMALYNLARLSAGTNPDYNIRPNFHSAEKFVLECFLRYPEKAHSDANLHYLYAIILENLKGLEKTLQRDDIYLIQRDCLNKAIDLGHPEASEYITNLNKVYHYENDFVIDEALKAEPLLFLLKEYGIEASRYDEGIAKTPMRQMRA